MLIYDTLHPGFFYSHTLQNLSFASFTLPVPHFPPGSACGYASEGDSPQDDVQQVLGYESFKHHDTRMIALPAALVGKVIVNVLAEDDLSLPKSRTQTAGFVRGVPAMPFAEGVVL